MITKGFTFNFTPLSVSHGISLVGSSPDKQNYSSYDKVWTPDYTLVRPTFFPWVNIIDKDGILTSGSVNSQLANIKWTEQTGTKETVITSGDDYEVTTTGAKAGTLVRKTNIAPDTTITLRFSAQYTDTRTNQVFYINDSLLLSCNTAAPSTPTLSLNIADSSIYNPLRDASEITVKASLHLGSEGLVSDADTACKWQVSNDGEYFHTPGDDNLDYWVSVNGNTLTINRELMGNMVKIRCYAGYKEVNTDDLTLCKTITLTRRIPDYRVTIEGVTGQLSPSVKQVELNCVMTDASGIVDNMEKEFMAKWYAGESNSSGNATLSTYLGHGKKRTVSTDFVSTLYGGEVGVELTDRGAWGAMADSDGSLVTDENGNIIVIH